MNNTAETINYLYKRIHNHFIKQVEPSFIIRPANEFGDEEIFCRYRDDRGNSCALGGIIVDEHYHEVLEGGGIISKKVFEAVNLSLPPEHRFEGNSIPFRFLCKTQNAHDKAAKAGRKLNNEGTLQELYWSYCHAQAELSDFPEKLEFQLEPYEGF